VPHAAKVREGADIKTMVVGIIVDTHQAEAIVANGEADLVAIGHAALNNPNFAFHAQQVLNAAEPDAPFSHWAPQLGWWLDNRAKRLEKLGP
jgi:2,4-dienoyl-CoA reductase-like NADH-dependent reductase (Old Yellow Enzyme family)